MPEFSGFLESLETSSGIARQEGNSVSLSPSGCCIFGRLSQGVALGCYRGAPSARVVLVEPDFYADTARRSEANPLYPET